MSTEHVRVFDFTRMLLGSAKPLFLFEVLIRLAFLYAVLVISMRLMGRRLSAQLSRNELLAMVSLEAAIGPAVQDPKRGILPALVVAACVVVYQRSIAWLMFTGRFESLFNGDGETLVRDGRVIMDALHHSAVSRERVLSELRGEGITHLGQVERVYMEASGGFTTVERKKEEPGLTVVPSFDDELLSHQAKHEDVMLCANCGARVDHRDSEACTYCRSLSRTTAVTSPA